MIRILDTNHAVTGKLAKLKAAGVRTVIRYVSTNTAAEKCVKPAEAHAIAAAGLRLGLVFEVWGGADEFAHGDINAHTGKLHGEFANAWARNVGAPGGAAVYFAIDTDASAKQIGNLVLPYFQAVKTAFGNQFRVGVYGCGTVCAAMLDAKLADLAWLSNAMGWNGSRAFKLSGRWALLQSLPKTIAGLDADPDTDNRARPDIGDFVPFAHKVLP